MSAPTGPIQLTAEDIEILGRPNFQCSPIAWVLIKGGLYAPLPSRQKSEYEQAVCIHWISAMRERHGDKWRDECAAMFRIIQGQTIKPSGADAEASSDG